MSTAYPELFQPFEYGSLKLSNRIAMAPMSRYRCPENIPHADNAAYYRRRAEGGAGLIISEGTFIGHPSATGYEHVPHFYGEDALSGWAEVVKAVHQAGAAFIPQLWHAGSFRQNGMGPDPRIPGFSPSGIINNFAKNEVPPKAMTQADIDEVIAGYAVSAEAARQIGCDGLEIHGAHGYLLDEFFWPETNRRDDDYGGSIENRVRLACEVVAAVRASVGPDFTVLFRLSQWKQQDFTARIAQSPEELAAWVQPLADAGVDIFHASTRRYWESEFDGSSLNLAGWIKKLTGCPTMTVGSIGLDSTSFDKAGLSSIQPLTEKLAAAEFDLISVGRAMLSEPEWANKIKAGNEQNIQSFKGEDIANYY